MENSGLIIPGDDGPDQIPDEQWPKLPDGTRMSIFQVRMRQVKNGTIEKSIFIDGELLDWAIDVTSFLEAQAMAIKMRNPSILLHVKQDIERHFTEAVSETLGRPVTSTDIQIAIKSGWI